MQAYCHSFEMRLRCSGAQKRWRRGKIPSGLPQESHRKGMPRGMAFASLEIRKISSMKHVYLTLLLGAALSLSAQEVKEAAKKVGKGAKAVAEATAEGTEKGAKATAKGAKVVAKETKEVTKDGAKATEKGAKVVAKETKEVAKDTKEVTEKGVKATAKVAKKVVGKE